MSKYTGERLNEAICQAIGVDPTKVYRVVLDARVGEIARVTTFGYAETEDGKLHQFADVVKHYEIRERGKSK